jgi:hypothetical protein
MFTEQSIKNIEIIDRHVTKMNKLVKHPYFFSWSLPTNHRHTEITNLTYFCIDLGKYLIQETKSEIERCNPIKIMYFFGQVRNLRHCKVEKNIADFWNDEFSKTIFQNYFALDNAARGFHNVNNSEYVSKNAIRKLSSIGNKI